MKYLAVVIPTLVTLGLWWLSGVPFDRGEFAFSIGVFDLVLTWFTWLYVDVDLS